MDLRLTSKRNSMSALCYLLCEWQSVRLVFFQWFYCAACLHSLSRINVVVFTVGKEHLLFNHSVQWRYCGAIAESRVKTGNEERDKEIRRMAGSYGAQPDVNRGCECSWCDHFRFLNVVFIFVASVLSILNPVTQGCQGNIIFWITKADR